ncbi:8780_t:CDS:2 [Gigaspora margarita]|uniref:8780_t:CDS:1 n=1 Tax=Gigaspora margarita TaxID=4874 RepID=A0ABN7UVZ9_GIGMA|nr:8780_t:CDS:2 [Gigaspora margarita]
MSTVSTNYRMNTGSSELTSVSSNTTLGAYITRPILAKEQLDFYYHVLRIVVENGLTFRFVNNYSTKLINARISDLLELQESVTIMFDSWKMCAVKKF